MIFKYLHKILAGLFLLLSLSGMIVAQTTISEAKYDSLKTLGLINNSDQYSITLNPNSSRNSNQFSPPDSTFTLAIPASDDGSSPAINLPFNFCFWGVSESQVFINTNGNISFDTPFSTGTPFRFPFNGFKVIAPFWSDVDTRARGGVYYKMLPNALIVNWQDVGHFDQNKSRGNSYQLIITDGTSELLPFGYTVGFFYDKLEWTAGDASGGVGGFGGAPALIGINNGDGIRFSQAGRFDKSDSTFIADKDTLNGVENLVGKHIFFNTCDSLNNAPGLMGANLKDTIGVCVGDTLKETLYFLSPESNQLTYVQLRSTNFSGFQVLGTTSGQMATAEIEIIGSDLNFGFNTISFRVVDNGRPSQFLEFDLVVQVDSLPIPIGITGDTLICEYEMTSLSVPSIYQSYRWSTNEIDAQITVTPGNYTVTVSYNNCFATDNHKVNAYIPNINVTGPKYICLPDTVSLSSPGGNDTYLWSTSDTSSQINVTQNGTYSLTVTDKGCIKSDSIELNLLSDVPVKISASNIFSCNGAPVTLAVPNHFDKVIWNNGDTSNTIRVFSGSYQVTVTVNSGNGNVCTSVDSIKIAPAIITPVSVVGDSLICGDANTLYQAVGIYDSYYWDNESILKTATYDSPGRHWVTVTKGTCADSAYFDIIGNPLPNVFISGSLFYCDTVDSARLVANGGQWDSLFWNTGDTTATIYTGYGWKKVTVWEDGCSNFAWHPVNELINGVDVKGITEICPGQSTRLEVEFGFDLYQWNTGAIGFSTLVGTPGDYWCVVHLDSCFATTDTITVTVNTPDTAQIWGDTVMCDSAGGFIYADVSFQSFTWNTGERTPGIQYTSPGIYSVTVEDSSYCVSSDTVDIVQLPPLQVEITGNTFYCFNDSGIIEVDSFDHYLWSNGDTTQVIKAREGVYSITVTNNNGCKGKDSNWKIISSNPVINISNDTGVCENRMGRLWIQSAATDTILWSTGEITDSIFVYPNVYSVTLTDRYGCTVDSTYDFVGLLSPEAGIRMNPDEVSEAYIPVDFIDDSDSKGLSVKNWYWSINDSILGYSKDTVVTFYSGENLAVIHSLLFENGCSDTTELVYSISTDIVKVNIITPNGDGVNDYLVFPNLTSFQTNELIIFNRWGTEVARFENYRNFWDANEMEDGVYFYVLYLGENFQPIKGHFTIIR